MKNIQSRWMVSLFSALLLICLAADGWAQENYNTGPLPAWVEKRPADNALSMFFTGTGFSANGNLAEAERFATDDIISQIVKFVGVSISTTSTLEAKGNLDNFEASISKQVVETSSARMEGFRVADKWSQKNARGITVSILVSYERAALLKEKERLEKIFIGIINLVKIPEEEAGRLAAAGRFYEAALRYIDAAVAASESNLEDSDVAFNRTIREAMANLEKINLVKMNDNLTGFAGEELARPMALKVAAGNSQTAAGIPQTAIQITYFESKGASDLITKNIVLQADNEGIVSFAHPKTTFVGKGKVTMEIFFSAYSEKLKRAAKKYPEKIDALQRLVLSKSQEYQFTVFSKAKSIPLVVYVVDLDENGKPLASYRSTASGIAESLSKEGFQLKAADIGAEAGQNLSESALADLIASRFGVERAIIGTASVDSFSLDQGRYIMKVRGTVKVIDLKSKNVLYEKSLMKSLTGTNLDSVRTAAFKLLGKDLGLKVAVETQ